MAIFCNVVIIVNLKIFLISYEVSTLVFMGVSLSILSFFACYSVESAAIVTVDSYNTF